MPEGKRNETLEIHIGIVGTEAKINQEELVKSRRKIWSLPMALVTALLLVGLFGAAVLAQVNEAPTVVEGEEIENQKIIIGAGAAYPVGATDLVPNTSESTGQIVLDAVFEDEDDTGNGNPGLVYTALTANGKVARVDLGVVADVTETQDVVALWWD